MRFWSHAAIASVKCKESPTEKDAETMGGASVGLPSGVLEDEIDTTTPAAADAEGPAPPDADDPP